MRRIHRSPVNSPHKGKWRGALKFPLICARINGWVNNREAGDLRRHQAHCDVIVMMLYSMIYILFDALFCCGYIISFNILWPGGNSWHFTDNIFKCIFLNEDLWISINISLKFVPEGHIHNIPALVQVMAWHWPGGKPLSEPILVILLTYMHHSASVSWNDFNDANPKICQSTTPFTLVVWTGKSYWPQGLGTKTDLNKGKWQTLLFSLNEKQTNWDTQLHIVSHWNTNFFHQFYIICHVKIFHCSNHEL